RGHRGQRGRRGRRGIRALRLPALRRGRPVAAATAPPCADDVVAGPLGTLCQAALDLRLLAAALCVTEWPGRPESSRAGAVMAVALLTLVTAVALARWQQLMPRVAGRSRVLLLDAALCLAVLGVEGPRSVLVFVVLSSAVLAGLLLPSRGAVAVTGLCASGTVALALAPAAVVDRMGWGAGAAPHGPAVLLALGGVFPLAAVGAWVLRHVLERRRGEEQEARRLASHEAMLAERARLARELHDTLAKTVEGTVLAASALRGRLVQSDPGSAALADDVLTGLRTAALEARTLMLELRDAEQSLGDTAHGLLDRWARRTGVVVHEDVEELQGLHPRTRHELLAVLSECLANVERHSGARRVEVRLVARDGEVLLCVRDHGRGLPEGLDVDALPARGSLGLAGVRERVRSLGGSVTVVSEPGGLRVQARVPWDGPGELVLDVRDPSVTSAPGGRS
ncbi:MAG TPA: ATP-binding protein, partial [Motilibacteraceae bacterium]|nr:ATP-binding protein [Motilibacteraceae bacterium]